MKSIQRIHWFLILLPLFFVAHGLRENFGFIELYDCALLLLHYWFYTAILWSISYALFRNATSSALMTTALLSYFFFFGALKDFFASFTLLHFLAKYSVLLGIGTIGLIWLGYRLYKKDAVPQRFTQYLSTLFSVLVLLELAQMGYLSTQKREGLSIYFSNKQTELKFHCAPVKKPNIYFLLFDEYENSASLKNRFQFNNTLDTALLAEHFKIIDAARSNYNFTPFSMASILNMEYLKGLTNPLAVGANDYAQCNTLIKNNRLIHFLGSIGYEIRNYSIFDMAGHPSQIEQSFLPLKSKLISDRTLFAYIKKDIGWKLMEYPVFSYLLKQDLMRSHYNNQWFQQNVIEDSKQLKKQPFFLYAHFYMPHPPFYVNNLGQLRSFNNEEHLTSPERYLDYVLYTNKQIIRMARSIKKNDPTGVIVIMGDHGFRNKNENADFHFNALNAIYFPDQQYALFDTAHSHVNQFRLVLNKLFCTELAILDDHQVFLKDK